MIENFMLNKYLRFTVKMTIIMFVIISLSLATYEYAHSLNLSPQGEKNLNVYIDTESGSIINISEPVYSVTSSKYFKITPVGANLEQKNSSYTDVTEFEIKQINKNIFHQEKVTFVLASKNALNINFIPKKNSDKYYKIKTKNNSIEHYSNSNSSIDLRYDFSNFLSTETKLIKSMIMDTNSSFQRTVVNRDVDLYPYANVLSIKLVRVFQGANLFGYTFLFKNISNKTIEIAPQHLAIGNPNRTIMAQSDRFKLTPCSENRNECVTAVRYVIRDSDYNFVDSSLQTPDPTMPFIISNQNKKGL